MQNELLIKLSSEGCNIVQVLEDTYCGQEDLMVRIISKVPQSPYLDKLVDAVAANDVRACFESAHELKGVYAVAALTPLYDKCSAIVEITRKQSLDGVSTLLAELKQMHDRFCNIING